MLYGLLTFKARYKIILFINYIIKQITHSFLSFFFKYLLCFLLLYRIVDADTFISKTNGRIRVLNPSLFFVITYLMGKISFIVFRLVLPLFSISLGRLMLTFFIAEFLTGYYLTFVFQVLIIIIIYVIFIIYL